MSRSWVGRLFMCVATPLACAASEGGSRIVLVADSRRFSGLEAWWANLYNDSLIDFAVATILTIPLLGFALGMASDVVMKRLGINLRSRQISEG
jgi:hypothetical protein